MELKLDRFDLKRELQHKNISQVAYEDFKEEVQQVIREAGFAVIYDWDGKNYNRIYPSQVTY